MAEGVVSYFVSRIDDHLKSFPVDVEGRILSYHKNRDLPAEIIQGIQDAWHLEFEILREIFPSGVAVSFHVRPLVVEIERKRADRFFVFHGAAFKSAGIAPSARGNRISFRRRKGRENGAL